MSSLTSLRESRAATRALNERLMPLVCVGISHHTAPVEVRERYAIPEFRATDALIEVRNCSSVSEAVILQTCGRLEVYACVTALEFGLAEIKTFLSTFLHGRTRDDIESFVYAHVGDRAVEQLFRVSTGLDTMLLGEPDILAQIKRAYVQAQHARSIGSILHRLFCEALRTGKSARSKTSIGRDSLSIANVAVAAAKARLRTLRGKSVLVIGAGKMARVAVRCLRDERLGNLLVSNRTMPQAHDLISQVGFGKAVELPRLVAAVESVDIVLASSASSEIVLAVEQVREAMARRPERPLFIVDIAVPRNADPGVASIGNVTLVDVDDLAAAVDATLQARRQAIPQVEQIVAECVQRFTRWHETRVTIPVISALTRRAEAIRATEFKRLFERCPNLTERERALISGAGLTLVSKLLHPAVSKLRAKTALGQKEALLHGRVLGDLFELNLPGAAT